MKKILATALLLSFATISVSAADIPTREQGYVSVNADATKEFAPDMAKITFSVQTYDKDMTKAVEDNKKAAASAINAVKKHINTANGEFVKTTSVNVNPEYNYKNNIRTLVRYSATNSFDVTIKDTSKLGTIISSALDNGANSVSNLNYMLQNNASACNSLIQQAAGTARARANSTAAALGTSVVGIKNVNAQCSADSYYQPRYANTMLKASMDSATAESSGSGDVPTEEGTIKLRANVNAQFYVK